MKYKIKKGDTLSQIAQDMGVSMNAITKANKIEDVDKIYAGRTLTIPGVGKEKVSEKIEVKETVKKKPPPKKKVSKPSKKKVDDKTFLSKLNIPTAVRQFLNPYKGKTEKDIPKAEMAALRDAWDNSQTPERLAEKEASGVASNVIEYKDYGTRSEYGDVEESGFRNMIKDLRDPRFGIKGTLGQASGHVDPATGQVTVKDQYNYNNRTRLQGIARLKSYLASIPKSGFGYGQMRNIATHFGPPQGEGGIMNIKLAHGGQIDIPPRDLERQVQNVANQGRYGDSMLVHMNPQEVQGLAAMSGTGLTTNPQTGQPEAFLPFLAPLLGSWLGGTLLTGAGATAATAATAGAAATAGYAGLTAATASAIGSGLATWAESGDIEKGMYGALTGMAAGTMMNKLAGTESALVAQTERIADPLREQVGAQAGGKRMLDYLNQTGTNWTLPPELVTQTSNVTGLPIEGPSLDQLRGVTSPYVQPPGVLSV